MKLYKIHRIKTPKKISPAVYGTDRGTLLVQGYKVDDHVRASVEGFAPDREDVIEIPIELLTLVAKRIK